MNTLDHLDEHAQAVAMGSVPERLEFLRRPKWFGYTKADVIFEKLEDLLCHPPTHRMPGLQILGDSNSGKTAIGLEFVERHPVDPNPQGDSIIVPVVRIELPPNPDESRLYDEILIALRQPFRAKDPISEKARQVRATLGIVSCRMLIIDEFQHVLAPRNDRQRILINTIKHLSNTLQIPVVVIGTSEAQVAVSKDEQLTNRLYPMWMPNWKLDREYRRLLASFEVTMPLRERSNLQEKQMATLILELSEGLLGEVRDLLCMGCEHALKAGKEQVDIELIRSLPWIPRSRRRSRRMPIRA